MRVTNYLAKSAGLLVWLSLLSAVSIGFFIVSAINNRSLADWYLVWNLFLAWLPLVCIFWLLKILPLKPWLSWQPLSLTALWLIFLPNSFYLVSDLLHLQDVARANILYDSVMFESFVLTGLLLGYVSLYVMHEELRKRISNRLAALLIGFVIFLCSFAIYLGRDLRWNSWDVLLNPAGILFDISELIVHFRMHEQALTMTLAFFILLTTLYFVARRLALFRPAKIST
jgi:uncharacterized membrane protein